MKNPPDTTNQFHQPTLEYAKLLVQRLREQEQEKKQSTIIVKPKYWARRRKQQFEDEEHLKLIGLGVVYDDE